MPRHNRHSRHLMITRSRRRYLDSLLGGSNLEGRTTRISDKDFIKRHMPKPTKIANALEVTDIDLNKEANRSKHHTDCYDNEDLIVRRGYGFLIKVTFNRKVHHHSDKVNVKLTTGRRPVENKGGIINFRIPASGKSVKENPLCKWNLDKVKWTESGVSFELVPLNAAIGTYQLFIETGLDDKDEISKFETEDDEIHVIFNPWWSEDDVYMPKSEERDEYVLNESGRIWVGSSNSFRGRPWNFGQFDKPCLEAAIYLLDRAELKEGARRNVVSIVRTISAQANSMDDYGVLEGRWTKKYPKGCTLPWSWNGSVAILEQFMKKGETVKYGQCWVFSGVVTTLLRTLGIPTRSVTNFQSAHDTDCSMTIDSHFDEDGEPVEDLDDSIWNFHVWNESWFRRPDLPAGYDGWQAVDATPQEVSDSVMRCGPAPLKAIKEGHVYLNYDIPFIFSEVNGDQVLWRVNKDKSMEVLEIDSHAVGKNISTKAIGSCKREDVTHLYKYKESSPEERRVVAYVNKFSSRSSSDIYTYGITRDVKMEINVPETKIGKDFSISVKLKNTSNSVRVVSGRVTVVSSFYTGIPAKRIKGETTYQTIKPKSENIFKLDIKVMEYISKLNPEASMIIYSSMEVAMTSQRLAQKSSINLIVPELKVQIPSPIKTREKTDVEVWFNNPLPINLTNSVFNFECAGAIVKSHLRIRKPIKPGETVSANITVWPIRRGKREIAATFSSDQLSGVDGDATFKVV